MSNAALKLKPGDRPRRWWSAADCSASSRAMSAGARRDFQAALKIGCGAADAARKPRRISTRLKRLVSIPCVPRHRFRSRASIRPGRRIPHPAATADSAHTAAPRTRARDRPAAACAVCRQRSVAAVADGDQHIAQEAVAADALDRRFAEQGAKARHRPAAPVRPSAALPIPRAAGISSRARACANLFQGQTARQSSQP